MSTIDLRAIITKDVCSKDEVLQAVAKYWNCTFEDTDKKVVYAYREERQLFHIWLKSGDDDWDSSLTEGTFQGKQSVTIGLNKEEADRENIFSTVQFLIRLAREHSADALIVGAIHNDICLVQENKVIWADDFMKMYKDMIEKLGTVETERFISVMIREKSDYTKWRQQHFADADPDEFHTAAVAYRKANPLT